MKGYLIKRVIWIPLTLGLILLFNFILIHFVQEEVKETNDRGKYLDNAQYNFQSSLSFREYYGLHLPLFFNFWPFLNKAQLNKKERVNSKEFQKKAPYCLMQLCALVQNGSEEYYPLLVQGVQRKILDNALQSEDKLERKSIQDLALMEKILQEKSWIHFQEWVEKEENKSYFAASFFRKLKISLQETQFYRYFSRVLKLDFGSSKLDPTRPVTQLVFSHFKTSIALLLGSLLFTFFTSQLFGLWMALKNQTQKEVLLGVLFLILYAMPIYFVIPLLIEKVGIPLDLSSHALYLKKWGLPIFALSYSFIALYTRFNKSLFLSIFQKPYIKIAKARGLSSFRVLSLHVLREAIVTLVPLFLGSIGTFLSSLVLVETLFEIRGFGFLFYQALTSKDYHTLLFSTCFASLLALIGHFFADFFIVKFDPRISQYEGQHPFSRINS